MATASLYIYAVWLLVALVVRGVIQLARTGDHGFRLQDQRTWSAEWFAHAAFVVALLLGGLASTLAVANVVEPVDALVADWSGWTGGVLAVVGIVATFIAQLAMGASWRVGVDDDERTDLVVRWPFTWVRNPIFTTMAMTAVGLALMVPGVLSILGLVLLAVALEHQVRHVEEPYLRRVHGPRYERYLAEVGRFVPGLGLVR
jgi:protein-S-isoprenylcysteine O-methyltransferase Ste14